jgi:hypothetical protein
VPAALPNPDGVIDADDLAQLVAMQPTRAPAVERTTACAEKATSGGPPACSWDNDPFLLGFDAKLGRGAMIDLTGRATAGEECPEAWGEVFDLRTGKVVSRTLLFRNGPCSGRDPAISRFALPFVKRGIVPVPSLVTAQPVMPAGATGYGPLVMLDAPLCGWMLQVAPEAKRFVVTLVSPGNDRKYALGTLPLDELCMIPREHGGCAEIGTYAYPMVGTVVLTPDRTRLFVSIEATPGGHNMPLTFHHALFALPAGVLPAP